MQPCDLIDQIERLIQTGELPRTVQASSALLLGRLQSVINVRLMGPDRERKAALLAAFTNTDLLDVPTAEIWLKYGDVLEVVSHFHDGTSQVCTDEMQNYDVPPVRIDIVAPIPALELLSFHLVGDLDATEGAPLTGSHAFQDADIVIWCTQVFEQDEANQWDTAPDRLKDHSFLVSLPKDAALDAAQKQALEDRTADDFYLLHHIDLKRKGTDATTNLMADIFQIAKSGRRADQDSAAMLLKTYEKLLVDAPPITPMTMEMPTRRPRRPGNQVCGIYIKALTMIENCALELCDPLPDDDSSDLSRVLIQCSETSQSLADLFDQETHDDNAFQRVRDDILTASDQLTLMTMEEGMLPAIDAVTTLVQLKRDIEIRCAA